jgi:small subunit ribosomal protein S6
MKNYELLVILNAKLDEANRKALIEKIKGYLQNNEASIEKVDEWGTKKLAYPVNYQTEGYYTVIEFKAPASSIQAVEPKLRIEDNIMRILFTAK